MIPIKLEFCGINSAVQEVSIDFERLTRAGIFGIFGATGSGKSTILDAVILALYGEIPRFEGSDYKNFINVTMDGAWVKFSFEAGGCKYQAERTFKRNKAGGYSTVSCRFFIIDGDILADRKKADVNRAIEEVIGLSYEDFVRTVVLPQGKFSEFMLLKGAERTKMLERLFGLELYGNRVVQKINAYARDIDKRIYGILQAIDVLGEVSREILDKQQGRQEVLTKEIAAAHSGLEALEQERGRLAALNIVLEQLKTARNRYSELLGESERMETDTKKLACSKDARLLARQIEDYGNLQSQSEQAAANYAASKELVRRRLQFAQKLEQDYDHAKAAKEQRIPALITQEATLSAGIGLGQAIAVLEAEREEMLADYKEIRQALIALRDEQSKNTGAHDEAKVHLAALETKKSALRMETSLIERLNTGVNLEHETTELFTKKERLSSEACVLTDKAEALAAKYQNVKAALAEQNQQMRQNEAARLAVGLNDGEKCLVCGSSHHPQLAAFVDFAVDDKLAEVHERLAKESAQAQSELVFKQKALAETEADLAAKAPKLAKMRIDLGFENFAEALKDAYVKANALKLLEEQEILLRTQVDSLSASMQNAAMRIVDLSGKMAAIEKAGKEKKRVIDDKSASLPDLCGYKDINAAIEAVRAQIKGLQMAELSSKDAFDLSSDELKKAQLALAAVQERHNNVFDDLAAATGRLQNELSERGFDSVEQACAAMLAEDEQNTIESRLAAYNQERLAVEADISKLCIVLQGQNHEEIPSALVAAHDKHQAARSNILEWEKELAVINHSIQRLRQDLDEHIRLSKEKAELTRKSGVVHDLESLFRGNAFIKHLATKHLRYIAIEASKRLKDMTLGRLAIDFDEESNFRIRDDFNNSTLRPPASLSGGETFMASLCLALALSAKIQMKNRTNLSFFFLDEGFGSLDKDALEQVVRALEQLRDENMTVGLITHVEELKSRILEKIEL